MAASHDLTTKEKIVDVVQRMPEDATIDDAIYRLHLLKAVAEGLRDIEEGRLHDHDQVFNELLKDDEQNSNRVERSGKIGSARAKETDRKKKHQEELWNIFEG
jgi:predicted transcriptional regulator